MKSYIIKFTGRQAGALGIREFYIETIEAPDARAAVMALYDRYEQITVHEMYGDGEKIIVTR